MALASSGLAFLAGLLSILSPCVLPLVPLALATALTQGRFAPVALAGGVAMSFLGLGLFVTTIGVSIGLDGEVLRRVAAVLLLAIGVVCVVPLLQARLALAAAPLGAWVAQWRPAEAGSGFAGQFGTGVLLGAVWTPCAGPTLGAASVLAAQGRDLPQAALTMLLFAIGTAVPLLGLGLLSREVLLRWRGRMLVAGQAGRIALGLALIGTATAILLGVERALEAALVDRMPPWLTELTSAF
jgi:cytochrome c-type biogenesis protein